MSRNGATARLAGRFSRGALRAAIFGALALAFIAVYLCQAQEPKKPTSAYGAGGSGSVVRLSRSNS